MQTFQWARLKENVKTPLRRGAWYPWTNGRLSRGGAPGRRDDVECSARRARRSRRRRGQRVARPGLVDAQIPEQRDAIDRCHGLRAAECPADRIGPDRNGHARCEARVRIAQRVLYLDLDRRGHHVTRRDIAGLDPEDQHIAPPTTGVADGDAAVAGQLRAGARNAAGGDEGDAEVDESHQHYVYARSTS